MNNNTYQPDPNVDQLLVVKLVVDVVGLLCLLVGFLSMILALQERLKSRKSINRIRWLITAYLVVASLYFAGNLFTFQRKWDDTSLEEEQGPCDALCKILAFLYISSNYIVYLVLHERSSAVLCTIPNIGNTSKIHLFSKLIHIGANLVPGVCLLVFISVFGERVGGGYCFQHVEPTLSIIFMVADTGLSVGFLMLFVFPVIKISKDLDTQNGGKVTSVKVEELRKLAYKNLKLSIWAIGSTFISMLYTSLVIPLAGKPAYGNENSYHFVTYPIVVAMDVMVNYMVMLKITNVWKTNRWSSGRSRKGGTVMPETLANESGTNSVLTNIVN